MGTDRLPFRTTEGIFHNRVERLIAFARAALAVVSLQALSLAPAEPDQQLRLTFAVLAGYSLYSVALAVAMWARRLQAPVWGTVAHVIDILVFTLLLFLADGPASLFLLFVAFALLAAGLKWRWTGIAATTAAMILMLVPSGLGLFENLTGSDVDLQRVIVRGLHIAALGAIVAAFSLEQERIGREVLRLRSMPQAPAIDDLSPSRESLRYATDVFQADRACLVWSDPDEPWIYVDQWDKGQLQQIQLPPDSFDPLIAADLAGRPFLLGAEGGDTLYLEDTGKLANWPGAPVHADFRDRFDITKAVVLPLRGQSLEGWLFVTGKMFPSPEHLSIANVIVPQINATLDRASAVVAQQRASAAEQRLRFARDLHDGVLQFLAGTAMQIESILKAPVDRPQGNTARRLQSLQDSLLTEQREVRAFIRQLRPGSAQPMPPTIAIEPDLTELVQRLREQWNVAINLAVSPEDAMLPSGVKYDLLQLVREATANAVRHGAATTLDIAVSCADDAMKLGVRDNGTGLGVNGTFEAARLAELKLGPRSLRERVITLNGSFTLKSDSQGMVIDACIPI